MSTARVRNTVRLIGLVAVVTAGALVVRPPQPASAQVQGPTTRPFSVTARRYRFEPARIEVFQDDLVKIELRTEDIAHSWTVDDYRIAKRVGPGSRSPSSSAPTRPARSRSTATCRPRTAAARCAASSSSSLGSSASSTDHRRRSRRHDDRILEEPQEPSCRFVSSRLTVAGNHERSDRRYRSANAWAAAMRSRTGGWL